jgi:hypothetical protein
VKSADSSRCITREEGRDAVVLIDLPAGSYVPEFRVRTEKTAAKLEPSATDVPVSTVVAFAGAAPAQRKSRLRTSTTYLVPVILVFSAIVLALSVRFKTEHSKSALGAFWRSVWGSSNAVLLCLPQAPRDGGGSDFTHQDELVPGTVLRPAESVSIDDELKRNNVAWPDVATLCNLVGYIQRRGKDFRIQYASSTKLPDLREGPVVLIGAYNNAWVMRLSGQLRFTFYKDRSTNTESIRDRRNPSEKDWTVSANSPYLQLSSDYGIISSVWDVRTGRVVVIVSGLVGYGTVAGSELLTNPIYMAEVARHAPKNWQGMNMQTVYAAPVIAGGSGPPRILTSYFW